MTDEAMKPGPLVWMPPASTMRDQFAMAALSGMGLSSIASPYTMQAQARAAYVYADAMLAARLAKEAERNAA